MKRFDPCTYTSILATVLIACAANLRAEVKPNALFGHHMVLQQDLAVPIWGTAEAGEKVAVGFNGQKRQTVAKPDGTWSLKLDPMKVSDPGTFTVNDLTYTNVVVGEVWLGSGQSNMAGGAGGYAKKDPNLTRIINEGPYPKLRLFDRRSGQWRIAQTASINAFSAIHFSFGFALQHELDIPVGLMYGAVGGTPSGRWLTREMAAADPALKAFGFGDDAVMKAKHAEEMEAYKEDVAQAKKDGKKAPRRPRGPIQMGDLYDAHIKHYVPYGMRGVLWDQGESKTALPDVDQITTMHALINGWRHTWHQGDFPFLHVQKPSGGGIAWDGDTPVTRLSKKISPLPAAHNDKPESLKYQLDHIAMGKLNNAPLVTALDLEPGVHPTNKSGYGKRAATVALGAVYGKDVAICGPVYKSHKIEGSNIRITYDHTNGGLAFKHADTLQGFEIAGADGKWEWAKAVIDGDTVLVSHENIPAPVKVQYAFSPNPSFANLFNKEGWPALMFTK
ncbi:MAG: sialate O-acetylesterase [Kiritimatiellia bacterium]|jgi:sialate O-acetylesterase